MSYTNGLDKPTDYFNTVLYTGNSTGGTSQSITGVGFQPDWVWTKSRSTAIRHYLFDSVRGVYKELNSDDSQAEETKTDTLTSFDSNGFSLGSNEDVNGNAITYASWNWLASNTTASNTDGSITSTVSANTTSGFSIVSYTGNGTAGATIGHGLGVAPSLILTKNRTSAYNWHLWTHAFSSYNDTIQFNTNAPIDTGTLLNNTAPTSSVITLGNSIVINESSSDQLAYVFAEKKGFSKFGSYTGNGSSNGSFAYLGFRPAFVIVKRTDSANAWHLFDNKRNTFNPNDRGLFPDTADAENTGNQIDFLSNGIKFYSADGGYNGSGATYIYMAFAENPFVTSTGIPACAR